MCQAGAPLATVEGQGAGIAPVGLGQMQGAREGADLGPVGAMGGDGQGEEHAEQHGLMTAGGLAHRQRPLPQRFEGGEQGLAGIGHRDGPAGDEVVERDAVLGDIEAEDGLDRGGKLGHDRSPALDCLRARRAASHRSQQASEAGAAGAHDEGGSGSNPETGARSRRVRDGHPGPGRPASPSTKHSSNRQS